MGAANPQQAGEGHNSKLTDREHRALRMDHIRKLVAHNHKVAEVMKERKRLRGVAKADGFKLSEIDAGIRLMEMEDQKIFIDEIKELYGLAQDFGIVPMNDQGDLFADRRPVEERAYDEGLAAGLAGKGDPNNPPYGIDSKAGQAWLNGWNEGQEQMRKDLQSAMEKRNREKEEAGDEVIKGDDAVPLEDEKPEGTSDEDWDKADPEKSNVVEMKKG